MGFHAPGKPHFTSRDSRRYDPLQACPLDVQYGLTPSVFYACKVHDSSRSGSAIPFISRTRYDTLVASWRVREAEGEARMEWVTPGHEEVDLSCEVSGYANAEL